MGTEHDDAWNEGARLYNEGNTLSLNEVPPRLYSEICYELQQVADAGSGFNEKWEDVTWA